MRAVRLLQRERKKKKTRTLWFVRRFIRRFVCSGAGGDLAGVPVLSLSLYPTCCCFSLPSLPPSSRPVRHTASFSVNFFTSLSLIYIYIYYSVVILQWSWLAQTHLAARLSSKKYNSNRVGASEWYARCKVKFENYMLAGAESLPDCMGVGAS